MGGSIRFSQLVYVLEKLKCPLIRFFNEKCLKSDLFVYNQIGDDDDIDSIQIQSDILWCWPLVNLLCIVSFSYAIYYYTTLSALRNKPKIIDQHNFLLFHFYFIGIVVKISAANAGNNKEYKEMTVITVQLWNYTNNKCDDDDVGYLKSDRSGSHSVPIEIVAPIVGHRRNGRETEFSGWWVSYGNCVVVRIEIVAVVAERCW